MDSINSKISKGWYAGCSPDVCPHRVFHANASPHISATRQIAEETSTY
jgi:hypothetical protein